MYSVVTEKRRNFAAIDVDASLKLSPGLNDPSQATQFQEIDLVAGEWFTLNASGKVIRGGASQSRLVWANYVDGDRTDVQVAGLTGLQGNYVAQTSMFDDGGTYNPGDPLAVKQATIDSKTRAVLANASASGDIVVGVVELPLITDARFDNGLLQYNTMNVGHVIP
jgi:hypothetical protein